MSTVDEIYLRLDAPFAAWRWLQAGGFRGTFPVIPHSAAWGLVLNLASIETRGDLNQPVTSIRPDAPHLAIAVGMEVTGTRGSLYQQLHSYPVGNSGAEFKERAHGSKYWIAPARREVLVGAVNVVGVRGDAALLARVERGLRGDLPDARYGLPFAGDNQFLFNRIDVSASASAAWWFAPVPAGQRVRGTTRLTTNIDRSDSSRTEAPLFAPAPAPTTSCPPEAWIPVGPQASGG